MIDTRRAVPMPDDGKLKKMTVITEPAEALHVLRRLTGRNVYIPGQALMMDEDVRTSDPYGRETFLAACLPKRI
jgi:hypothetical protein